MKKFHFVNEDGLATLKLLAQEKPSLFLDAQPDALIEAMGKRAATSELWDAPLDIRADLSELNELEQGGPTRDGEYARVVRNALGHLPPSQGLNEHRWASINCFVLPQFASMRWSHVQPKESNGLPNFVSSHWLSGARVSARQNNSIARLWWMNEFSKRAAHHTAMFSADELLDAMADNVNLYHQLLSRPILLSRPRLLAAIYELFLDSDTDNDYLGITRYASELLSSLNFIAAQVSLDLMDTAELRNVIEEAKPPKEP